VVVTTAVIRCAQPQSNGHHQQTNIQFFTGRMPFLLPNQQCQSTEWKCTMLIITIIIMPLYGHNFKGAGTQQPWVYLVVLSKQTAISIENHKVFYPVHLMPPLSGFPKELGNGAWVQEIIIMTEKLTISLATWIQYTSVTDVRQTDRRTPADSKCHAY